MKSLSSALTAVLVLAAPMATMAQLNTATPHKLQPNEHALNLPGATTFDAPPAGFDPISASDQDLQYHGFPPRPNQNTEPKAYASWVSAMKASKTRILPKLEQTTIYHGPAKQGKPVNAAAVDNTASAPAGAVKNVSYSYNWSGYADFSGATSYGANSFYYVVNDMVVPKAQQAFGACTGGWDWGSAWNGIDGWGSSDVLQAGVEFDAYCALGGAIKSSYYSTWYEWYPYGEVRVNFPVTAGDDLFVEVWHTSSTQGYAYVVNRTNNNYWIVGFLAYPGYPLVGNSAEWVVERPSVGGSITTLTNYTRVPFWDAYAYTMNYAKFFDIDEAYPIDMLDNSGYVI